MSFEPSPSVLCTFPQATASEFASTWRPNIVTHPAFGRKDWGIMMRFRSVATHFLFSMDRIELPIDSPKRRSL